MRRDESHSIKNIIESLEFVNSLQFKLTGRYPKIGTSQQLTIIAKMFAANKKIAETTRTKTVRLFIIGLRAADTLTSSRTIHRFIKGKTV